MRASASRPHKSPPLAGCLTVSGALGILAGVVVFVDLGADAGRNGGNAWIVAFGAAGLCGAMGLLLLAAGEALRYLAALARHAGRLDVSAPLPPAAATPETSPTPAPAPAPTLARPAAIPRYFYKLGNANYGPVVLPELQRLINAGTVQMDTRVRLESSHEWTLLSEIAG